MNRYLVALLLTLLAVATQVALVTDSPLSPQPFIALFCGAAVLAAWYGGFPAGLCSTVLAALALDFLFSEPRHRFRIARSDDASLLLSFVGIGLLGSWMAGFVAPLRPLSANNRPVAHLPNWVHLTIFAGAYVLAGGLGQRLALIPGVSIVFWPPTGLFLAALLLNLRSHWPGYILAAGLAELACNDLWFHNSLPLAVAYFMANALEAVTAAWLIGRFVSDPFRLENFGGVVACALLGAGVAPMVGATIIATIDALIGKHAFTTAWQLVWLGDGTGLLVSLPLALTGMRLWQERAAVSGRRVAEAAVVGLLLVAVSVLAYRGHLPTAYLTMPLVLWAAVRFHLRGAAVAVAVLTLVTAAFVAAEQGEFAGDTPADWHAKMVMLQTFLGVTAVSALLTAALSLERQQAVRALSEANRNLEYRVEQRTTMLKQQEEQLRLALSASNAAAFTWDIPANEVRRLTGIAATLGSTGDAPETFEMFLARVHPDDRDAFEQRVRQAIAGPATSYANEYRVIGTNGSVRWIADTGRVDFDNAGRPLRLVGLAYDITEQRRAESEVLQREAEYRSLFEAAGIANAEADLTTGQFVRVNQAFCEMVGYTAAELLGGMTFLDITHPDDRERNAAALAPFLRDGSGRFEIEKRYVRKDGQVIWVNLTASPVQAVGQTTTRILGSATDITKRKNAEEKLKASEERYRLAADAVNGIIYEYDFASGHVERSRGLHEVLGYQPDEVPPTSVWWSEQLHPDELKRATKEQPLAVQGNTTRTEYRVRHKDGRWLHVEDRAVLLRDAMGKPIKMVGCTVDVTARKEAEQRLQLAQQAGGVGTFEWDMAGGGIVWSPELEAIYGLNAGEFKGGVEDWRQRTVAEDFQRVQREVEACLREREPTLETEFRAVLPDGSHRWLAVRAAISYDGGGLPVRMIGVKVDITERKVAEVQLQHTADALKQADHRKDEFLATLAHELRNPLAPIRSALEIMKLPSVDGETIDQARNMMERQVAQMTRLIDDLMDVSRISQGKIVLLKTKLRLAEAIQQAVETSRPIIEQQGHELVLAVPNDPIVVNGDATRLCQVFANILNNSAKYTNPGGRIRLYVEQRGPEVVVLIEDNGVGIAPNMLPKVFDLFAQVDRSLEKSQGGLGIGLNIVKRIVEMHDGIISVESDGQGKGSRFFVRLPIVKDLADEPKDDMPNESARPARRRILVVDDNRDAARSLSMLLKIKGNELKIAHDGLQALEVAAAFRPHVVLMDIGMPKLNGYDACRQIRAQEWGQDIVLVAQTGWGQEDDKRKSQEAGFDFHMVKPLDLAILEKKLAELL